MSMKRLITVSCAVAALSMSALWGATSELADAAKNKKKAAVQALLLQKADVNATLVDGGVLGRFGNGGPVDRGRRQRECHEP